MTRLARATCGLSWAVAIACQSSTPTRVDERPQPLAKVTLANGQPETQPQPSNSVPVPQEDSQPTPAAQLVDRLYELAKDWNLEGDIARIERALEVRLSEVEGRWSGTSTRWPLRVAYHPKRDERRGSLHVSFTSITNTRFADLTRRFGEPTSKIKDKESLVDFGGPSGTRVVAGLFDGLEPTSPVAWIRLEGPGPRPPPPKDLF